jgi:hypothetical protein
MGRDCSVAEIRQEGGVAAAMRRGWLNGSDTFLTQEVTNPPAGRWLLLCRAGDYSELDSALLNVKHGIGRDRLGRKWTGLPPARQSSDPGRFWRGRPPAEKTGFLRRDWWSGFTVFPDFTRSRKRAYSILNS